MARNLSGVHVITASGLRPGRTHLDVAQAAVEAGARVVQLRDKTASTRELVEMARAILRLTAGTDTLLLINDRVDVALAAGAAGVHLGPDDLPWADARRLLGPDRILGVSAVMPNEVSDAEAAGADYLGVGPAFATRSKADAGDAIGPAGVAGVVSMTRLPVIAVGAITADNAPDLRAAGAAGIAVLSFVAAAERMVDAIRALEI